MNIVSCKFNFTATYHDIDGSNTMLIHTPESYRCISLKHKQSHTGNYAFKIRNF